MKTVNKFLLILKLFLAAVPFALMVGCDDGPEDSLEEAAEETKDAAQEAGDEVRDAVN